MSLEHSGGLGARGGQACAQKPLAWQPAQPWGGGWAWQGVSPHPAENSHEGTPSIQVQEWQNLSTVPEIMSAAAPRQESGRLSEGA